MTSEAGQPCPILTLEALRISLAGHEVLRVDTLSVAPSKLLHLTGGNGAGKTALLRALSGALPCAGRVRVCGFPPGSPGAWQATAFVPTDAEVLDDLNIGEHLTFMAAAWRVPEQPLLGLAERFGLGEWLNDFPLALSRGTRQKLALAVGLGLGRPLTLLDEPFGTLDTASREVLRGAIVERCSEGGAVIVTTHGPELGDLPRRVLDLREGTPHAEAAVDAA